MYVLEYRCFSSAFMVRHLVQSDTVIAHDPGGFWPLRKCSNGFGHIAYFEITNAWP